MSEAQSPARSRAREYLIIFAALSLLTVLEVSVAHVPGHRSAVLLALFGLAAVKATCVGFFYMHLSSETKVLRGLVAGPLSLPVLYALVLVADSIWRRLG